MKFNQQELQEIINRNPVGDDWPYLGGTDEDIEQHLIAVSKRCGELPGIKLEAEFDHYGSGYASYVHLFCQRPQKDLPYERDGRKWTDGLALYLNRLTPLAVYGPETRTVFERGSSHGFLDSESVGQLPDDSWSSDWQAILKILSDEGFSVPPTEQLKRPLEFESQIATVFDGKSQFDALFYWED